MNVVAALACPDRPPNGTWKTKVPVWLAFRLDQDAPGWRDRFLGLSVAVGGRLYVVDLVGDVVFETREG